MRQRSGMILSLVFISASAPVPAGCKARSDSVSAHSRDSQRVIAHADSRDISASNDAIEAVSLLGKPLVPPELAADVEAQRLDQLHAAQAEYDRDPHDEESMIWVGRRLAYLGRYRQALDMFSNGLAIQAESHKLLRHRGHRYITLRQFDNAIGDLERAAAMIEGVPDEIEPDGQPNERAMPTSTSHTNIYYHLGLARYLKSDFDEAAKSYCRCMEFAKNDDMRVATAYWLYLTLRRLDRQREASEVLDQVASGMDVIENTGYHRLLLMFKGELSIDEISASAAGEPGVDLATIGYGIGMHHLFNGDDTAAFQRFQEVIDNSNWAAFGHIAAEAELARVRR